MKRTIARIILVATLSMIGAFVATAHAAPLLQIEITPDPLVGSPGATVDVFYMITNPSAQFTVGDIVPNWTGSSAVGALDFTLFDGFFATIAPQGVNIGLLGQLTFKPGLQVGDSDTFVVDFTFNLFDDAGGLADSPDFESEEFTATVPEPATLALLGLALAGAIARRRRV